MNLDQLLKNLAESRTRILLDEAGTGLRIRGTQPSPELLDAVKTHKPALVAALQDARSLAGDLYRNDGVEAFAADLDAANARGDLTLCDWYAGHLALKLARRWQGTDLERAA